MADIFISYSQKDRALAQDLSAFLTDCGYDVWWDYDLVGGIKFRDQIKQQLAASKAAIVIWTQHSVESEWVIDEAEDAKQAKKLLPTRAADLDFKSIPLGFRQFQTDPVDKPELILRSLDQFGVKPSSPPVQRDTTLVIGPTPVAPADLAAAEQFAAWEYIKDSRLPADFRSYVDRFPSSPLAEVAAARLARLEEDAWQNRVMSSGDPVLLREFVRVFAGGRYEGYAKRQLYSLENTSWGEVDKSNADAVAEHLQRFPDGFSAQEARTRLQELREGAHEEQIWKVLAANPTREGLETFLKRYPLSPFASQARAMLVPVIETERRVARWAMIKREGYSEQLRAFIQEFKSGPEVDEAKAGLARRMKEKEAEAWAKVQDERHPAPILSFLATHPDGDLKTDALAVLRELANRNWQDARLVVEASKEAVVQQGFSLAFPQGHGAPPSETDKPQAANGPQVSRQPDPAVGGSSKAGESEGKPGARPVAAPTGSKVLSILWAIGVVCVVAVSLLACIVAGLELAHAVNTINGREITFATVIGITAAAIGGLALRGVVIRRLQAHGQSLAQASAIAHVVTLTPVVLWVWIVLWSYRGMWRSSGNLDNLSRNTAYDFPVALAATWAALMVLAVGLPRLPSGTAKRWTYHVIVGIAAAALAVGFGAKTLAAPVPLDYYLTAAAVQYTFLVGSLATLWCFLLYCLDARRAGPIPAPLETPNIPEPVGS